MNKMNTLDCPVAFTMGVIGTRWTSLILRDLFLKGACRFQDLQNSLEGIAPSILSQRLKALEENGIIERQFYSEHPPRAEYILTDKGNDLSPIVAEMRDWGDKYKA